MKKRRVEKQGEVGGGTGGREDDELEGCGGRNQDVEKKDESNK